MSANHHRSSIYLKTFDFIFRGIGAASCMKALRHMLCIVLLLAVSKAWAVDVSVGEEPIAVAINPETNQAVVVEEDNRNMRVVDIASRDVLDIVPLDYRPTDVALNPMTETAVVTHEKANKVSVIDLSTNSVVAIIDVGREPEGIAVDPNLNIAVVVNEKDDSATLIDLGDRSVVATVPVGKRPEHVAVNAQTGTAVVSNERDDSLSLINLHTHTKSRTVAVPREPGAVAINADTGKAVVAHKKTNKISIIDIDAGVVISTVDVGRSPVSVAVNPIANRAVVASRKEDSLTLVDLATNSVVGKLRVGRDPTDVAMEAADNVAVVTNGKSESVSIIDLDNVTYGIPAPAGRDPRGVAIHKSQHIAVVANEKSDDVTLIDLSSGLPTATVTVGRSPYDVAVDTQRSIAAITLKKSDRLALLDLTDLHLMGTLEVGRDPRGVAIDPVNGIAVVAGSRSDSLTVIDMNAHVVTATIPTGREPRGVSLQVPEGRAWVTLEREDSAQVIDLASHSIVATIPVGNNPSGIAISESLRLAVVANRKDDSLTLIDLDSMSAVAVVAVGREPRGVAIDDLAGRAYVANRRSNTVSVVDLDTHAVIDTLPAGRHPEQVAVDGVDLVGIVSNEGSDDVTVFKLPDTIPPEITVDFPPDGQLTNQPQLKVTGTVSEPASLTINTEPVDLAQDYSFSHMVSLQEGSNTLALEATDSAGNSVSTSITVTLDTTPPQLPALELITISNAADGTATVSGAPGSVEAGALVTVTNTRTQVAITVTAAPDGSFSAEIDAMPGDGVVIASIDTAGNGGEATKTFVGGLPPDPADTAPPIDPTVATNMYDATEFLYDGGSPIQAGVVAGTIDKKRVGVLRGTVLDRGGSPVSGVTITVHGHPEYGRTMTRGDGMFDMAVNGGGDYVVDYIKEGYFPVQRRVSVPWQDYTLLHDVVLVTRDQAVTAIDLNSASPMQVAQGSIVTDDDGPRQATVMFPQGTQAEMVLPDGSVQSLEKLHIRATEYTVGDKGEESMPALLPATSGYTYAVEFSVDEAVALDAKDVRFSQPVPVYINNFLEFPTGSIVPAGYYSREKAAWIPSANGRVIEILGVSNGLADIDINGTGQASDASDLAALGITDSERQQLAKIYSPGTSLWRVSIPHFSPWDFNWPYAPAKDARRLNPRKAVSADADKLDDPNCQNGSIIECENQILGESVGITGTPYSLHYRSDRTPGRKAANILTIPLTGDAVPATLKGVELEIAIAGRRYKQQFPAVPDKVATFTWDGKDAYGREMQGEQRATINIDYAYNLVLYTSPDEYYKSFLLAGISPLQTYMRKDVRLRTTEYSYVSPQGGGAWDGRAQGFGGWSLNIHHAYDPVGKVLYLGDGSRRSAEAPYLNLNLMVASVAGNGVTGFSGDGGPALDAQLAEPDGISVGPDGSIYFADSSNNRIRRVSPDGEIGTVAGNGETGFSGDGGPAVLARLNHPTSVDVTTEGEIYISDSFNNRIRYVDAEGVIHTIVGSGVAPPDISSVMSGCTNTNGGPRGPLTSGPDGCPATEFALFHRPGAIAHANDGSLYFSLPDENRLYRLGTDGIITIFAGTGSYGYNGDEIPAKQAVLANPLALRISSGGSIIFTDTGNNRVRRVGIDGLIHTIAGTGVAAFSGDGAQAGLAALSSPSGLAIAPDDSVYVLDSGNHRVRKIDVNGVIDTYAGNGGAGTFSNGELAGSAVLNYAASLAFGSDGYLYIPQPSLNRIFRISQALHAFDGDVISIPSRDGSEIYNFDASGRHLRTVNAYTGETVYEFVYNNAGYLVQVIDADGNITDIERDALGEIPSEIVSPDGVRTAFSVDANGYLNMIKHPDGSTITASYTSDGLLRTFTDARGNTSTLEYDDVGQLVRDENAEGGSWQLEKFDLARGRRVNLISGEGSTISYTLGQISPLASPVGGQLRNVMHPDGSVFEAQSYNDGSLQAVFPDGTRIETRKSPDPRLGILAPITTEADTESPSGLRLSVSRSRAIVPATDLVIDDVTSINGRLFDSQIDVRDMTVSDTTPTGRQITMSVDGIFRPESLQINGINSIVYNRDTRGRLTGVSQGNRSVAFDYDSNGFLHTVTDSLGRQHTYDRDPIGNITRQTTPDGRVINITYDTNGNITSMQSPRGGTHVFTYDAVDQRSEYAPPSVGAEEDITHYQYNHDKQLTRITRPDGKTVDYGYDNAGRLSSVVLPRGQVSYAYNAAGQLRQIESPDNIVLSVNYDGFLPISEDWSGSVTGNIARQYDNNFQLIGLKVDGNSVAFNYDADGLLIQAGSLSITRDPQNGSITGTDINAVTTSRSYNGYGELIHEGAGYGSEVLYSEILSRDDLGRITDKSETIAGITTTYKYSYDQAGRLTGVQASNAATSSYGYDADGNRIGGHNADGVIGASYDTQDRLVGYNGASYTYTANGELLTKTKAGQTATYSYDALGNLVHATLPNGVDIEYIIDGENRRVGKVVNGIEVQGFLYQDKLNPVAELDGSGNVISRFVYGTHANVPDYMVKGGVIYRIITDHLGSPKLVVNTANGDIVQRLDYDEFGNITQDTNPGFQPFGFAGGIYDSDTGLTRFGARDYDAETGRWTTKDPIGFAGGSLNLYGYINNDPVNMIDIDGFRCRASADKYKPGFGDFVELLWMHAKELRLSASAGAAYGTGANFTADRKIGDSGDRAISGDIVKGLGAFAGATLTGDVASSGKINGVYQRSSICAGFGFAACLSFTYGAPGAWSIDSSVGVGLGVKYDAFTVGIKSRI